MPSRFARGVGSLLRTTQTLLMQIAVSVATAICVAYITGAYLHGRGEAVAAADPPPALSQAPTVTTPSYAQPAAEPLRTTVLPPLESEVIADLPDLPGSAHEVFPGVPAGVSLDVLRESLAPEKHEPRRVFGLAIPFT